jgi:zinc transport system substrate-binding protein
MRKRRTRNLRLSALAAVLILLGGLLASCGNGGKNVGYRPTVVATNFAVYDIVRSVAGDTADVEMLLPPETESHDYEITLADAAKIARADLFVCVGGESEDWVDDTLGAMPEKDRPTVLRAVEIASTVTESDDGILESETAAHGIHAPGEEEESEEADEHVWTSFGNIRLIARAAADALNRIDEWGASERADNMIRYSSQLNDLEREYADLFASTDKRLIAVADRFPFRYLAEEWGLEVVAAFSGCTSNVEASLATISALVDTVEKNSLPCVMKIELSDGRCAEAVARETGCEVLELQSGHNVTRAEFDAGVTLIGLMRRNLEVLRTALQ